MLLHILVIYEYSSATSTVRLMPWGVCEHESKSLFVFSHAISEPDDTSRQILRCPQFNVYGSL